MKTRFTKKKTEATVSSITRKNFVYSMKFYCKNISEILNVTFVFKIFNVF